MSNSLSKDLFAGFVVLVVAVATGLLPASQFSSRTRPQPAIYVAIPNPRVPTWETQAINFVNDCVSNPYGSDCDDAAVLDSYVTAEGYPAEVVLDRENHLLTTVEITGTEITWLRWRASGTRGKTFRREAAFDAFGNVVYADVIDPVTGLRMYYETQGSAIPPLAASDPRILAPKAVLKGALNALNRNRPLTGMSTSF